MEISKEIQKFTELCRDTFGEDLKAVILFGSAAEDRIRTFSDVNLMVILSRHDYERSKKLQSQYRNFRAQEKLHAMFICENEIQDAIQSFPLKFNDMRLRHKVVYGTWDFSKITLSPDQIRFHALQVIMNLKLRMREKFILSGMREEQLTIIISEFASALRSAACGVFELEKKPYTSARQAFASIMSSTGDPSLADLPRLISEVREETVLGKEVYEDIIMTMDKASGLLAAKLKSLV